MITVRFPSGFSIQYNTGNFVSRTSSYTDIYEKERGRWIAQVPTDGCVVEVMSPCRLYNPVATDSDKVRASVELMRREVRSLTRKVAKIGGNK